jgi:hypothetical protein
MSRLARLPPIRAYGTDLAQANRALGGDRSDDDMDSTGFSIWLLLILVAALFVVLWGVLFAFLAFGTWFIARNRLPDERDQQRRFPE